MRLAALFLGLVGAYAVLTSLAEERTDREPWVDPGLREAVLEWRADLDRAGIDYRRGWDRLDSITVGRLGRGEVGQSDRWSRRVVVDRAVLERGPESVRGLVYHELGHAVFRLGHGGEGIMRERVHTQAEYVYRWSQMLADYLVSCRTNESHASR